MASINVTWTQLKVEAAARNVPMQYAETSDIYLVLIFDGNLELTSIIKKQSPPDANDLVDFEANFKTNANKSSPSQRKPFADAHGYKSVLKGYSASAPANLITNLDIAVPAEVYLISVQLLLLNQGINDNCDMVVIDKNNVLGLGANFIYYTWMSTWNMHAEPNQGEIRAPFPIRIPAGLFFRIVYRSTNAASPTTVKGNFYLYTKA